MTISVDYYHNAEPLKPKYPHNIGKDRRSKSDSHNRSFNFYDLIVHKEEDAKQKHPHKMVKDHRSKSDHYGSSLSIYDLILRQEEAAQHKHSRKVTTDIRSPLNPYNLNMEKETKGSPTHRLSPRSLQRNRKLKSKKDNDNIWSHPHFLFTVEEDDDEGEGKDQQSNSHSHESLQSSDTDESTRENHVSLVNFRDLVLKRKEEGENTLGGMQSSHRQTSLKYTHSTSGGGKGGDGFDPWKYWQARLSNEVHSSRGGQSGNRLPLMKKKTKARFACKGHSSCYSLFLLYLFHPLKRVRDQYIKCCFSLAGGSNDLSGLVGQGHVVGPLFHDLFPQKSKLEAPRSDPIFLW